MKRKKNIILLIILLPIIIITIYNTSHFKQIKAKIKTSETFNEAYYKEIKVKNDKNNKKLY